MNVAWFSSILEKSFLSRGLPSSGWFASVCLSLLPTRVENVHFIGHSTMCVGAFGLQGIIPKRDVLTMQLDFIPVENTSSVPFLCT